MHPPPTTSPLAHCGHVFSYKTHTAINIAGREVLTNLIPGDLQLNENEHLHFSKFVGSPFLCTDGLCHEGTGPVSMPTAAAAGSVATATGFLDGACTESTYGRCGRTCGGWKLENGRCGVGSGSDEGLSYVGLSYVGLVLYVSDKWTGWTTSGSRSGT